MRPADVQAQGLGQRVTRDQPGAQPLAFVLEFEILGDVGGASIRNSRETQRGADRLLNRFAVPTALFALPAGRGSVSRVADRSFPVRVNPR